METTARVGEERCRGWHNSVNKRSDSVHSLLVGFGACGLLSTLTGSHHGQTLGASSGILPWKFGGRFSKKLFTPSSLSLLPNKPKITFESSRCAPSALSGPLYIKSRISFVEIVDVFFATSSAISSARVSVTSGLGRISEKRFASSGCEAG